MFIQSNCWSSPYKNFEKRSDFGSLVYSGHGFAPQTILLLFEVIILKWRLKPLEIYLSESLVGFETPTAVCCLDNFCLCA